MIPLPLIWAALKRIPWRLIVLILIASVLIFAGWRAFVRLPAVQAELEAVQAELKAERACEPATACQERAVALAELARQEAAIAAQAALGKAQEAEAKARADASAWRAKYRQAIATDPGCAEWASAAIRCPIG